MGKLSSVAILLLVQLLVWCVSAVDLPSIDVSKMSEQELNKFLHRLPSEHDGGWWIRIRDKLFSPAVNTHNSIVAFDKNIHHYWVVLGTLPSGVSKLVVAEDRLFHVHILHSEQAPQIYSSGCSKAMPIQNKMKLFMDSRRHHAQQPTSEMNLEEDVDLSEALRSISEDSYMNEIVGITSIGTGRNVAIEGHTTAEKYLGCRMQKAGLDVQLLQFPISGGVTGTDVVGCTKGASDKQFLIVGAHYDTLPRPPARSPGAMDNGSGVGVVMSTMEALSSFRFEHSICFTGFDGEELGLLGSHHMANMISANPQMKSNFLGAITSDMSTGFKKSAATDHASGWDEHNSEFVRHTDDLQADGIHIDGNKQSEKLVKFFSETAKKVVTDSSVPIIESEASIWNSDQKSFFQAGLPAIDICAANHRVYHYWHHTKNVTENLDPKIGTEISKTTVAASYDMAKSVGRRESSESADLEESTENIPRFQDAKTMQEVFGDVDCEAILSKKEPQIAKKPTKFASEPVRGHKNAPHTHMSREMARLLEEEIARIESHLNTK